MRLPVRYMAFVVLAGGLAACSAAPAASPTTSGATGAPATPQLDGPWTVYDNDADYLQINPGSSFTEGVRQTMTVFVYHGHAISPTDNRSLVAAPSLATALQHNPHV